MCVLFVESKSGKKTPSMHDQMQQGGVNLSPIRAADTSGSRGKGQGHSGMQQLYSSQAPGVESVNALLQNTVNDLPARPLTLTQQVTTVNF